MANPNDTIQDQIVTHQAYITRLGEGQGNQANAVIEETEEETLAATALALIAITSRPTKSNMERLAVLERKITGIRGKGFKAAETLNHEDMTRLANTESRWISRVLGNAGAKVGTLTKSQVKRITDLTIFAGRLPSDWWKSALLDDINRIMLAVRNGVSNSLSVREIVRSISGTKTQAGTMESTRNSVRSVARTITTGVSNSAQTETSKKNSRITRVQWVSVLDSRTSTICRGLSGKVWRIDEPHPELPAHASCRSSLTYLIDNNPKAEDLTYQQWLERQPDSVQRDILPKWQYEEFKDGAPLTAFVTKDITPMTMKEFDQKFN